MNNGIWVHRKSWKRPSRRMEIFGFVWVFCTFCLTYFGDDSTCAGGFTVPIVNMFGFWHSNSSGMTDVNDDMMWGIVFLVWLSCGEWIICEWMSTLYIDYIDKSDSVEWIYPGFQWSPRWHHNFLFGDPCEASQPSWSDPVGDDPQQILRFIWIISEFPDPSVWTSLGFERSPCMWTVRYEQSLRPHRDNWWMEGKQWQLNSTVMFCWKRVVRICED